MTHFSKPGTTPKGSERWEVPPWLPDLGDSWGAWQCSGGDWHVEQFGSRAHVQFGDVSGHSAPAVPCSVEVGRLYVSDEIPVCAAGMPRLLEILSFCGLIRGGVE